MTKKEEQLLRLKMYETSVENLLAAIKETTSLVVRSAVDGDSEKTTKAHSELLSLTIELERTIGEFRLASIGVCYCIENGL